MNASRPRAADTRQVGEAAGFGGRPLAVVASNFRRINKNTLIATVDLTVPRWKMRLRGCLWHKRCAKEWVTFPAREWIGGDGASQYAILVEFTDRGTSDRFRHAALAAVHALAGEGG